MRGSRNRLRMISCSISSSPYAVPPTTASFSFHGPYAFTKPNDLLMLRIDFRSPCAFTSWMVYALYALIHSASCSFGSSAAGSVAASAFR